MHELEVESGFALSAGLEVLAVDTVVLPVVLPLCDQRFHREVVVDPNRETILGSHFLLKGVAPLVEVHQLLLSANAASYLTDEILERTQDILTRPFGQATTILGFHRRILL